MISMMAERIAHSPNRLVLVALIVFFAFEAAFSQLPSDFQKVTLVTGLKNSVNFEFAPDGRIFIVDRYGEIFVYSPSTQTKVSAGVLDVFHDMEDGLLALAFDPNFEENQFIYIHYSDPTQPKNRVSRFQMNGDQLVMSSEIVVIEWTSDRNGYYHAAGDLDFDSQGYLYIAIGDNTNHTPYSPLNENDINQSAERTSSNTNDLRGKILRIKPEADGSYTIPEGNLFPGGVNGRPEIYVMGARNPYKIFVDRTNTDWLFWGEVGPDANAESEKGPEGRDEINLVKSAGNYGWPYFSANNRAYLNTYTDPPFYYNAAAPLNTSKWNTGAVTLPPARASWLDFFHGCHLAGPRYYYDAELDNPKKLPSIFHQGFFYYDFNTTQESGVATSRIWFVKMDAEGNILSNQRFAPGVITGKGFIDMKIGPDGQLYILEYGEGCCPGNVGSGKLLRIDYTGIDANEPPQVMIAADKVSGPLPLTVNFSSAGTYDPEGGGVVLEWDFDSDGTVDSSLPNPVYTYTTAGTFTALLRARDNDDAVGANSIQVFPGNTAATLAFLYPPNGGMFGWEDVVNYQVQVEDAEDGSTADGSISCEEIGMIPSFGHLDHTHDGLTIHQCSGTYILDPTGHDAQGQDNIYYGFKLSYTDTDGLTVFDQILMYPKLMEAEFFNAQSNTKLISNTDPLAGGVYSIRALSDPSYIVFANRNLYNIHSVSYRVSSKVGGTIIEIRSDSPVGPLLSTVSVPVTGSENRWTTVSAPITDPGGKHDLYVIFRNAGAINFVDLNYIEFLGPGISTDMTPPHIYSIEVLNQTEINVRFNEPLDPATALDIQNYAINNGVTVSSASLEDNRRTVHLSTSPLTVEVENTLTVRNIKNEAGVGLEADIVNPFIMERVVARVNMGGPLLNIDGDEWQASNYNTGGAISSKPSLEIKNTTSDALYQTELIGDFILNIPVGNPGMYDLRLHFAELVYTNVGGRIFNVGIENGQASLIDYDIFAMAGYATAHTEDFAGIEVEDGHITLTFSGVVNNPKISAVEVFYGDNSLLSPDVTIVNPADSLNLAQPFDLYFKLENWWMSEGSSHILKMIDDQPAGAVYTIAPIRFDDLSPGFHKIGLVLVDATGAPTEVRDEVYVSVSGPGSCLDNPFPLQWDLHTLDSDLPYRAPFIAAKDIDGDGFKDIVTGPYWYRNPHVPTGTWVRSQIGAPMNNAFLVYDLDRDGDLDVLGTNGMYLGSQLAWAANDGKGNFVIHTNIPATAGFPAGSANDNTFLAGCAVGNFNGVENIQIALSWNGSETTHAPVKMLTVPADPSGTTWIVDDIAPNSVGEALHAVDIDGDGDLDLTQAKNWLKNDNGSWTTVNTGISVDTYYEHHIIADLDRNGTLDGVLTQIGDNKNIFRLNIPSNPELPWTKTPLGDDVDSGLSLDIQDLDFDGDLDIITAEWKMEKRLIAFENDLCNSGTWIKHILHAGGSSAPDHHNGAQAADLDNDGDLDIISLGWDKRTPRIYINNSSGSPINHSPVVVNSIDNKSAVVGVYFTYTFPENTFSDPDEDTLMYSATLAGGGTLPLWLHFDSGSRTFSGTPQQSDIGSIRVRLTASDGDRATNLVFNIGIGSDNPDGVRLNAGGSATPAYGVLFDADSHFQGGSIYNNNNIADIAGTDDDAIYKSERYGVFSYEVPVSNGSYLLRLHFAEIYFGATGGGPGGVGKRVFNVLAESVSVLSHFDIYAEAGAMTALIKEFEITVTDGILNLSFVRVVENPKVSAIEIVPTSGDPNAPPFVATPIPDQSATVGVPFNFSFSANTFADPDSETLSFSAQLSDGQDLPSWLLFMPSSRTFEGTPTASGTLSIEVSADDGDGGIVSDVFTLDIGDDEQEPEGVRINSGGPGYVGTAGAQFLADGFYQGGSVYTNNNIVDISGTIDDALYRSERYNLTGYNIPVVPGSYLLRLHFAEIYFGATSGGNGGVGKRVFGVSAEGIPILSNFDIYAEVGAMTALTKEFEVVVSDGMMNITFNRVVENPKISAIEVVPLSGSLNQPPAVIQPIPDQVATEGVPFSFSFGSDVFADPDDDPIDYAARLEGGAPLPIWLSFSPASRTFSGLPVIGGPLAIELIASDGRGGSAIDVFTLTVFGNESPQALRINGGGPEYISADESIFAADQFNQGGHLYVNNNIADIAGTDDDELYKTERYKMSAYNIPVEPGTYVLRLHFAEIFFGATGGGVGGSGKRVFDVLAEGIPLLTGLDIYAEVGAMTALVKEFVVDVADGSLNITFVATVNNAKVSAIEVIPVETPGASGVARISGKPEEAVPQWSEPEWSVVQVYPNPVAHVAMIEYRPPQSGRIQMDLINMIGSVVSEIYSGEVEEGLLYTKEFDVSMLAGGIYFVRLQTQHRTTLVRVMVAP